MHRFSNNIQGIMWMVFQSFMVAIITIATREAALGLNVYMVSGAVYSIAFILHYSWIIATKRKIPATKRKKMYLIRGIAGLTSYLTFAYGLTIMSMADVSAIIFTSPLFGVILAIMFFNEKVTFFRIFFLITGFIGAIIVINPDGLSFSLVSLIVLLSSFLYAIIHLSVKSLTTTDSHGTIAFYTQLTMFIFAIPAVILAWQEPTMLQLFWCFVVAICWYGSLYGLSKSHHNTDAIVVMPFQFMRLVFVVILGIIFFDESIIMSTVIGSIVILTSAICATKLEINTARRSQQ